MNLKKNILYILVSTVLCLSIITYSKSAYADEPKSDWQLLYEGLGDDVPSDQTALPFTKERLAGTNVYIITLKGNITRPAEEQYHSINFSGTWSCTIDLDGHTLDANLSSPITNGYVISSSGGTLTIKNGTITGGNNIGDGGGIYSDNNLILENVIIENCHATNGGGVYSKNTPQLKNVTITNCDATNNGGGLYFEKKTTLQTPLDEPSYYVDSELKAEDLKINNCTATNNGGGAYLKGLAYLGGETVIDNNKDGNDKNNSLCLSNDGKIEFGDGTNVSVPSSLMKIGITLENMQNTNISTNGSPDYASYLVCDDGISTISFNGSNFVFNSNIAPTTSSSKKYKVIYDKTMVEKISGSGKKGSKRTIYTLEDKEVESISLVDKNNEDVELTKEDDGTYTFIQPKSNVTLDISYKQNEIILNLDSNVAKLNGEEITLDVKPLIKNNRTMLPIRFIAESLGAKVEWDAIESNMIYISKGNINIEIKLGSNIAKINDKEYELDSEAFAEDNRTFISMRFIAEGLNCDVIWTEEKSNEVIIKDKN